MTTISCLHRCVLLFLCATLLNSPSAFGEIKKFQSSSVEIEDRFLTNTLKDYKVAGDVEWSNLELKVKPNGSLFRIEKVEASFQMELDLWPGDISGNERSVSRINLVLVNNWELVISIIRGIKNGQIYRQAIVTEIDRRDQTAEKPTVTELRRLPLFTLQGEVEHWSLRYHNGLIELSCNAKNIGTTYSKAFSSWANAVGFTQLSQDIVVSRFSLSGKNVGYSPQQREIYNRINAIRQEANNAEHLGELGRAIELERSVLSLAHECFGKSDISLGLFHQSIGNRMQTLGKHAEAQWEHKRSSEIFRKSLGVKHPETLSSDMLVAEQQVIAGQVDEGAAGMREAVYNYLHVAGLQSHASQNLLSRLAGVLKAQAQQQIVMGNYADAQSSWQEIVNIYTKLYGTEHWEVQDVRFEHEFAIRLVNAEGKELEKLARFIKWSHQGELLFKENKMGQIVSQRKDMLPEVRSIFGNIHPKTAGILIALSIDRSNEGEVDQAIFMLKEGLDIHRQLYGENNPKYAITMSLLGSQLSMLKHYAEATPMLKEACKQLADQGYKYLENHARSKLELGRHLIRIGQNNLAATHLTESLRIYHSIGKQSSIDALKVCERLADISRAAGNIEQAERYTGYQRNIILATHGSESGPYIDVLTSEAAHLYIRHRFEDSVKKYTEAAALVERVYGKKSRAYDAVIGGIIKAYLAQGDIPAVVKYFEERLEYELYRRESLFNVYSEQGQLHRSLQDRYSLDSLLILALEGHLEPRRAYNHAIAFKGAVTAKQRSTRIAARNPDLKRLHEEFQDIERRLLGLVENNNAILDDNGYDALVGRRDRIKAKLVAKSEVYRVASNRTQAADLQRVLPGGTVLIDYFEYRKPKRFLDKMFGRREKMGLVAFVLASDGEVSLVDLGPLAPIDAAWIAWQVTMEAEPFLEIKSEDFTLAELTDWRGDVLRKLIWDPFDEHLQEADTVIISPSAHLSACSFAALPAKTGGSFLIEKFAIATITTPRLLPELLANRSDSKSKALLLVGDIDFDSSSSSATLQQTRSTADHAKQFFTTLPSAELELNPIRRAFLGRYQEGNLHQFLGKHASEENIRRHITGAQFIHFHTHGFCLEQGELITIRSGGVAEGNENSRRLLGGIALAEANQGLMTPEPSSSDGILWASEIAGLDLHAADLVTLSACQTAIGDLVPGEGLYGAQRALYVAGARSTLATLWSVNDQSTKALMSNFYTRFWDQRLSKAKSLQQAMIYMLREYQNERVGNHSVNDETARGRMPPAFWAGFILHGDWR